MDRDSIIQAVQVRLDELSPFDDIEEVPAINYIDKLLNASTDTVFRILPYTKLPLKDMSEEIFYSGYFSKEWVLDMPDGYIKLAEARLDDWKRPVTEIADKNTQLLQSSIYTMGKPSRPVVVERRNGSDITLHFFSSENEPSNPKVFIVESKLPEECPDELVDAISWQCASDVLISLGKNDAAKVAQEKVLTHNL